MRQLASTFITALALAACSQQWGREAARPGSAAAFCPDLDRADRTGPATGATKLSPETQQLLEDAVHLMDTGGAVDAVPLLEQALAGYPDHSILIYELAFAAYLAGDKARAISLLLPATARFGPLGYQMLGNVFDESGRPGCAMRVYAEGLELFPDYGGLYYDSGVVALRANDWEGALARWEQGIARAPRHASNYFEAAKLLARRGDRVWPLLYGEAFLHLEPDGRRAQEMSKLLFQWHYDVADVDLEKPIKVKATRSGRASAASLFDLRWAVSGLAATKRVARGEHALEWRERRLSALHRWRATLLAEWRAVTLEDAQPLPSHPLVELQLRLADAELLRAYDHWLFSAAAPEEAAVYARKHESEVDALVRWMKTNPFAPPPDMMARPAY